jgi:hypothetical protein
MCLTLLVTQELAQNIIHFIMIELKYTVFRSSLLFRSTRDLLRNMCFFWQNEFYLIYQFNKSRICRQKNCVVLVYPSHRSMKD